MDTIENKIEDYLSDHEELDEGLGRLMGAGWNMLDLVLADKNAKKNAQKSLDNIEKIMKMDDEGTLKPNLKKQLKLFNKKLEFYKEEFVKVLIRIERLAEELEKEERKETKRNREERSKYGEK